jgi:hypothetical protein
MTKTPYFHGSPRLIDSPILKGNYVSRDRCTALRFARRRARGDCYIYVFLLEPEIDLEQKIDAAGIVDCVLVRDTPFSERILVTDKLIDECRESSPANGLA